MVLIMHVSAMAVTFREMKGQSSALTVMFHEKVIYFATAPLFEIKKFIYLIPA